jgi:hypothetical protein
MWCETFRKQLRFTRRYDSLQPVSPPVGRETGMYASNCGLLIEMASKGVWDELSLNSKDFLRSSQRELEVRGSRICPTISQASPAASF